jgi:hypothetical protein
MARAVKNSWRPLSALAVLVAAGALSFGVRAQNEAPAWRERMSQPRDLKLIPFADPWREAKERWMDMDDTRYHAFIRAFGTAGAFSYRAAQVTLTYDYKQRGGAFRGHIEARGLKPNFAYQIKLAGKPIYGKRGWAQFGDDYANAYLGYNGRWWDDAEQRNVTDAWYQSLYVNASDARRRTIFGYLFIGNFVTNENGDASHDFVSETPLHVTWQDKQKINLKHHDGGSWILQSTKPPYWGYGYAIAPRSIRLWYEHEKGRPARVNLPPRKYNCRLLITEESFHAKDRAGGRWLTVLATEDFQEGWPDSNAKNDLVFEMLPEDAK